MPSALLNYLVRLGWSHGDQEIFSLAELCRVFDLAAINRSPASFNYEKLLWLNQHYLKTTPPEQLVPPLEEQLAVLGITHEAQCALPPLISAFATRSKTLKEMAEKSQCYLMQQLPAEPSAQGELVMSASVREAMQTLLQTFIALPDWTKEALHQAITDTCAHHGLKMGEIAQPLRVLLTGGTQSPPIDETLLLIGRSWSLERIKAGLAKG